MEKVFSRPKPLVLVGCGHMGRAMVAGWLKAGLQPEALFIVDPYAGPDAVPGLPTGHFVKSVEQLGNAVEPRGIVLAVKPQTMNDILPLLHTLVSPDTLVISIAAGIPLRQLAGAVGKVPVVRAMPNTPAAVGAGITGLCAGDGVAEEQKVLASELMAAVGETVWINKEAQMNAVTAVSGSGPAYVFHLVESLAAAGASEGLTEETAMQLARQTIIGAARLLEEERGVPASELRRRVTSPGGTTAAALGVLMREEGLSSLMQEAVKAARKRGEELAG